MAYGRGSIQTDAGPYRPLGDTDRKRNLLFSWNLVGRYSPGTGEREREREKDTNYNHRYIAIQ
jgi:hypothetical protein